MSNTETTRIPSGLLQQIRSCAGNNQTDPNIQPQQKQQIAERANGEIKRRIKNKAHNNKYLLILCDVNTRFLRAYDLNGNTKEDMIQAIVQFPYQPPRGLLSDNGVQADLIHYSTSPDEMVD
jgi:hypothetical protein